MQETELHIYQYQPDEGEGFNPPDHAPRAHTYDGQGWTVEAFGCDQLVQALLRSGATERPCPYDGRVFTVDARQLIEFIAEASGLAVEFRSQRRRQLTDEQRAAKRVAMAAINARKQGQLSSITHDFASQISTIAGVADSWAGSGAV